MKNFFSQYFNNLNDHLENYDELFLNKLTDLILKIKKKKKKDYHLWQWWELSHRKSLCS